jgi:hypothetical protein
LLGHRRIATALTAGLLACTLGGCGSGGDDVTSKQASAELDAQLTKLQERFTRADKVVVPWQQATRANSAPFCEKGKVRWEAVATVDVTSRTADGDSAFVGALGMLDQLGWEAGRGAGDLDDDPVAYLAAQRGGAGTVALQLQVSIERREPGWHYVFTLNTDCHDD